MKTSVPSLVGAAFLLTTLAQAQDAQIVGTWTSKSKQVLTGPGFYNPVDDRLIEPALPGISYSFTSDGWYEEAYYRAVANPTNPNCPSGIMQWQHGTYVLPGNGSIILNPIEVDGRQLTSTPCQYENSVYERYYQPEFLKAYSYEIDKFHNIPRLNIFQFDGSPMQPLYLAYTPPQMLPTQTLNPTAAPSATGKVKRDADEKRDSQFVFTEGEPLNKHAIIHPKDPINAERVWWVGIGLIAVGSALYMYPTKK